MVACLNTLLDLQLVLFPQEDICCVLTVRALSLCLRLSPLILFFQSGLMDQVEELVSGTTGLSAGDALPVMGWTQVEGTKAGRIFVCGGM